MPRFCQYCGAPLTEGTKYCTSCGKKIENLNTTETEAPSQNSTAGINKEQTIKNQSQTDPKTTYKEPLQQSLSEIAASLKVHQDKIWTRILIIVALLIGIIGIIVGVYFAMNSKTATETPPPKPTPTNQATTIDNDTPKAKNDTENDINDMAIIKQYLDEKDIYNDQITTYANDVNAFLKNHANFKNEYYFIGRANKILRDIKETHDAVLSSDIDNTTVKTKLIDVLDDEKDRIQGLRDGITASKQNRDYMPRFKHGTGAAYKYDADNNALNNLLQQ